MKAYSLLRTLGLLGIVGTQSALADLYYSFDTGPEDFQNVIWSGGPVGWAGGPAIKQTHGVGGWQMQLTKEFAWSAGGGSANQQLEMQALANLGANARFAFDVMVDGTSFPAGAATWFQFNVVGNSDGPAGWTQNQDLFTPAGWHNADDPTLLVLHVDQPFSYFGWQPGDSWFQFWTGANSEVPVNFYLDNVTAYAVPEPSVLGLAALGFTLGLRRRRS